MEVVFTFKNVCRLCLITNGKWMQVIIGFGVPLFHLCVNMFCSVLRIMFFGVNLSNIRKIKQEPLDNVVFTLIDSFYDDDVIEINLWVPIYHFTTSVKKCAMPIASYEENLDVMKSTPPFTLSVIDVLQVFDKSY